MTDNREDIYSRVTNAIIADLERGVRPWHRPWDAGQAAGRITRPLRANGQPYRGINVVLLWEAAAAQGFTASNWITFKQAKEMGANVRKGAKGTLVVYADRMTKTDAGADGEEQARDIYFMKGYTVFNVEQVEGLPDRFFQVDTRRSEEPERHAQAERFIANTAADIRHGGDRAFYAPHPDYVQVPPRIAFKDAAGYYATLAHELTHWTKHAARLGRELGGKRFGDEGYAREELVAEIGAAFLCCDLGIEAEPRDDHAAYLAHWLDVLKADKRAIFQAAAHAQKAADYLHHLQPQAMAA